MIQYIYIFINYRDFILTFSVNLGPAGVSSLRNQCFKLPSKTPQLPLFLLLSQLSMELKGWQSPWSSKTNTPPTTQSLYRFSLSFGRRPFLLWLYFLFVFLFNISSIIIIIIIIIIVDTSIEGSSNLWILLSHTITLHKLLPLVDSFQPTKSKL